LITVLNPAISTKVVERVPLGLQGLEPYATWIKVSPETLIKPFINHKTINVVVAGGKTQTTWFATDFGFSKGVLIDTWK
jgi:hypothetical protein